jgi:hypothetical protein
MNIVGLLAGGDRRSIGHSNQVVAMVEEQPKRFGELMRCLWSGDPIVRMRAADAAEKVSAVRPELLAPFKSELLGLLVETDQQEMRWHLAQMIPRLPLNSAERRRATATLRSFLSDDSSIVKTCAMQALADLAGPDSRSRSEVASLIEELVRTGTAAMRARGRKLVKQLQRHPRT